MIDFSQINHMLLVKEFPLAASVPILEVTPKDFEYHEFLSVNIS